MWPIPDNLSFAEAASLPLNYLTALHAGPAGGGRNIAGEGAVHGFADFGGALNAAISGKGLGKVVLLVGGEGLA